MPGRYTLAVALFVAGTGLAAAQPAPTAEQIIALRQGGMAMVGGIAESMKQGVAAGVDPKMYEEAANALVKWGTAYPALYPENTKTGHDTKAKPEIWTDRAGFEKANAAFIAASTKLAEAAKSGDKALFADAFKAEGQSCGGCHRGFKNR